MQTIARAWISDVGTILCLSQMCEFDNKICPRIETCEVIEVEIEEDEEEEILIKENGQRIKAIKIDRIIFRLKERKKIYNEKMNKYWKTSSMP